MNDASNPSVAVVTLAQQSMAAKSSVKNRRKKLSMAVEEREESDDSSFRVNGNGKFELRSAERSLYAMRASEAVMRRCLLRGC